MAIERGLAIDLLTRLDLGSFVAEQDQVLERARVEKSVFEDLVTDRVDLIPGHSGFRPRSPLP